MPLKSSLHVIDYVTVLLPVKNIYGLKNMSSCTIIKFPWNHLADLAATGDGGLELCVDSTPSQRIRVIRPM